MTTALIVLAIIIGLPLLYLATLEGRFAVRRSLPIAADRKAVFDKLRDFTSWPDWSPWLMHEPGTRLTYSESPDQEGGWYSWDGSLVGAGRLTHERFTGQERIDQRIEFQRPFTSVSRVWWELETREDGGTLVHWNMAGQMPFLFRFMAKKIPEAIGKDYATGLYRLRAQLVPDAEVPEISFDGPLELPQQTALTIHFAGHIEAMKKAMMEGFPKLGAYVETQQLSPTGPPFVIYHKIDPRNMHFNCDMAIPVNADTTSSDFEIKTFSGGRYYKTTLKGSYEFLELAWYQAYSHLRMLKLKPQSRRAALEIYENDPSRVAHSNEILTSILIPIE
jgi:DNA gyrase inhibitor GyrI